MNSIPVRKIQRSWLDWLPPLLLAAAVIFNLVSLYPEVVGSQPPINDGVLHQLALGRTVTALLLGQDATDAWMANSPGMGYPLFHYYQHLAYLPPALFYLLVTTVLHINLSLEMLYQWVNYLLLCLFPLSIYWAMRRMGFSRLAAALAALAGPLISTDGLYGYEYGSYVWRGYGMYTQLVGMLLLPLTVAQGYHTLKEGKGFFWAGALLAATLLSHLVTGYIALGSLCLLAVVLVVRIGGGRAGEGRAGKPALQDEGIGGGRAGKPALQWAPVVRLLLLLGLVLLVTAYFFVPFILDRAYMNRSPNELQSKYDSYGMNWVLSKLASGELFDHNRLPVLTVLFAAGLAVCLWRLREERNRAIAALALFWLLLYFGRPTWGGLLNLLPLSQDLHFHRLIAGFQLGGIFVIGAGLASGWEWVAGRKQLRQYGWLAAAALTLLLLLPAYAERRAYLHQNTLWLTQAQQNLGAEQASFDALLEELQQQPRGRVYAGLPAKWGKETKIGSSTVYALLNHEGFDMLGFAYHALSLNQDVQYLFNDGRLEEYNLFNVRYVVVPKDFTVPSFYHLVTEAGRYRLYKIETSGYFDLVDSDFALAGDKSQFLEAAKAWLNSGLVKEKQHPAVSLGQPVPVGEPVYALAGASQGFASFTAAANKQRGRILAEQVFTNGYQAQVKVESACWLLLKATYHPGWKATVDGKPAAVTMLMPAFTGLPLQPGEHTVRFEYQPTPWRGWLVVLGLLVLAAVGLVEFWRARRGRSSRIIPAPAGEPETALQTPAQEPGEAEELSLANLPSEPPTPSRAAVLFQRLTQSRYFAPGRDLALILLVVILAGLPLFQPGLMAGHDIMNYVPRYVEFYEGLRAGEILPRWSANLGSGFGEPIFNFNPPLIYYLVSAFHALGAGWGAAENLASLLLLLFSGVCMYLLAKEFFGWRGGFLAAAGYLMAPYLLSNLYVRHAMADFSAFAFAPAAFWGLYGFMKSGRYRHLAVGAVSTALVLLGSLSVMVMLLPALALLAVWQARLEKSWRVLGRAALLLVLGVALAAFFVLPAIGETGYVHIERRTLRYDIHDHFLYLGQLFSNFWGFGNSVGGPSDGIGFGLGLGHLLLAAAGLYLLIPIRKQVVKAWQVALFFTLLLVLAVLMTLPVSTFLYEWFLELETLNFPWRFLSLAAVCSAFLCGLPMLWVEKEYPRRVNVILALAVVALLALNLGHAAPSGRLQINLSDYTPDNIAARGVVASGSEFVPVWVQQPPAQAKEALVFLSGQGRVVAQDIKPEMRQLIVEASTAGRVRLNLYYFPGWMVYVDGVKVAVDYSNPQGVMEFSLPVGAHGVKVVFGETPLHLASDLLSLAALLGLALGWLVPWKKLKMPFETPIQRFFTPLQERLQRWVRKIKSISTNHPRLGIYLLFLGVYLVSTSGHFTSTDEVAVYMVNQSLVERGSLAIKAINNTFQGVGGHYYSIYGIGQTLLSIPWYLAGKAVETLGSPYLKTMLSGPSIGDWGGSVPIFFVSLFNAFISSLTCVLIYSFGLQFGFSSRKSLLITLIYGFSTLTWVYAKQFFQHPLETLLLLWAVYILFTNRSRLRPQQALSAGILMGMGLLTRNNLALVVPIMMVYVYFLAPKPSDEIIQRLKYVFIFSLPVLLAAGAVLYLNQARFGNPFSFNPGAAKIGFTLNLLPGLYGNLFSLGRSVFLYSPPIIAGLLGFRAFFRAYRKEALLFLAMITIYLVLYCSYQDWPAGWGWGPRYLLAMLPFLVLPLGFLTIGRWQKILIIVLVLSGVVMQVLGVAVNFSYVFWQWTYMKLSPADAYLYVPAISPVVMHLTNLLQGINIDLWLVWVYQHFGAGAFVLALLPPLVLLALGCALLWRSLFMDWTTSTLQGRRQSSPDLDVPS